MGYERADAPVWMLRSRKNPGKYKHDAQVLKLHTFGGTWPKPVI